VTSRPSALITGASRGIGHGITRHLAAQGWDLTITARSADQLAQVREELSGTGATIQPMPGDIADLATLDAVVSAHAAAFGSMNALVLAAGVGAAGPIDGYPLRLFDKQFAVNVRAPFGLVAQALPLLRAGAQANPERGGRVIAMTSLEGVHPEAGLSAYGASKAALISLITSINNEEGANGISASAISPGFVNTDMSAWVADSIPPATMITVADVVKTVELLLSVSPNAVLPHIVINRRGGGAYHA
jgi:3-oxoacyl-[acyl-carrier protein] reductase